MFPLKIKKITGYNFGQKTSYSAHHLGVDYQANYVNLYAPFNGRVERHDGTQGGITLWFFPNGNLPVMRFMHLSKVVKVGNVNEGNIIAVTGNSGSLTTAPHLHLDISKTSSGIFWSDFNNFINPEAYNWGGDNVDVFTSDQVVKMYQRCLLREPESPSVITPRGFDELTLGIQNELTNRFNELEAKLATSVAEIAKCNREIENLTNKYQDAEKQIVELNQKIYDMQIENDKNTAKLTKEIELLHTKNDELQKQVDEIYENNWVISKEFLKKLLFWIKRK